jgi:tagatose-1,6-bisphosphate aldolase non-catalytic subunit AgaZ/GatZ
MTYSEREFGASQSDYEPKEQKMSDIVKLINAYTEAVYLAGCQQIGLADSPECQHAKVALEEGIERLRAGRAAVVEECARVADELAQGQTPDRIGRENKVALREVAERIRALKGGAA